MGEHEVYAAHSFNGDVCFDNSRHDSDDFNSLNCSHDLWTILCGQYNLWTIRSSTENFVFKLL